MGLFATARTFRFKPFAGVSGACLLLAGCAGGGASIPTHIPDGQNFHRYQTDFSAFEYTGAWKNSSPNGQGVGRDYDSTGKLIASCKGDFTTPYPASLAGKGEIYRPDGSVLFQGDLIGSLIMGSGCMAGSSGVYTSPTGWTVRSDKFVMVSFTAGVSLLPGGTCTLGDPQGKTWTGVCNLPTRSKHVNITYDGYKYNLPGLEAYPTVIRFVAAGIVNFTLANGPGVMRMANGEQIEGTFDQGQPDDGPVKITSPDGKVSVAQVRDGQLGARHLAASQVANSGQACGFAGWRIVSGRCEQNTWSGEVDAYDATGQERITGTFEKGVPSGIVSWARFDSNLEVKGNMIARDGALGFTQAKVSVGGALVYEGEMSGFAPNGNGICTVNGSRERCEYLTGERVDALYKTRLENDRLRSDIAASQQQQAQQAQQLARQQAAAQRQQQAQAEAGSGDLFGKVVAIGIGAGAVSSVSGVSSTIRNQMITGMAADILTDGKANGIATAQHNLQGASMGNQAGLKGSSAVGSRNEADALNQSLKNMAGMGVANGAAQAQRSKELDDIVRKVAADGGMKTQEFSYRCGPDEPAKSVSVPYKTEACRVAKQNWFNVYACNDVENMSKANQLCQQGCGSPSCEEAP
ncbi:hypothetical protein PS3A_26390 [Pseudomonas sp. 3A(2025)]